MPGNQTNLELSGVDSGTQYGLQICAFFSDVSLPAEQSPFRTVPVIPFVCSQCAAKGQGTGGRGPAGERCIDCSKIEESGASRTSAGDSVATVGRRENGNFKRRIVRKVEK